MKDLLAKLDALHAKATSTNWSGTPIPEFADGWPAVRAYIAQLEENVEQARRIAALGKVNIHDWRVYTMSHADDCKCFGCSMVDEYERP